MNVKIYHINSGNYLKVFIARDDYANFVINDLIRIFL